MDGTTSISISLVIMFISFLVSVNGVIKSNNAEKKAEGREQGLISGAIAKMQETLNEMKDTNELYQRENREEHRELTKRIQEVEHFVVETKAKKSRISSETT